MQINSNLITGLRYTGTLQKEVTDKQNNLEPHVDLNSKVTISNEALQSESPAGETPLKLIELPRIRKRYEGSTKINLENGPYTTITGNKKAGSASPVTLAMFDTSVKSEKSEILPFLDKSQNITFNLTKSFMAPLTPSVIIDTVPDGRQDVDYSCGAVALQTVLTYWTGQEYFETELMEMLHTTENGTLPEDIVRVAREEGLSAELKEHMTIKELEKLVGEGIPVIVDGQAWRDDKDKDKPWTEVWESGHYMVVIGFDKGNVYFEDPSLFGSRGVMTREEFNDRWHDYEGPIPFNKKTARVYEHMGIVIKGDKPSPPPAFVHID
jgi:predicted double-glycine peptidase